jgi:O-antigen/teichoic acid export membrane protein
MLRRRLTRNTLSKVAGEIGSRVLGLLFYVCFARWLGADGLGLYSSALAYAALFAAILDLGTNSIITRDLARNHDRVAEIVGHVNSLKSVSALLTLLAIGVSLFVVPERGGGKTLVMMMGLFIVGNGLLDYFAAVLSGLEFMGLEAVLRITNKALCLLGAAAGYHFFGSLRATVAGMLIGSCLNLMAGYVLLHGIGAPWRPRWNWSWHKALLTMSLPLLTAWIFWNLYFNQGIVLLTWLKISMQQVGWFAAGLRLIDVLRGVPSLLTGAFFPVLAGYSRTEPDRFRALSLFLVEWTLIISLPLATGTALLAEPIIRLIFGAGYEGSGPVLALAIWSVIGIFVNNVMINLLIILGMTRKTVIGAIFVALTHLTLTLLLVPALGLRGAALALVLSESAYLVVNIVMLKQSIGLITRSMLAFIWRPVAACLPMAGVLLLRPSWNAIVGVLVGGAVYGGTLLLLRGIPARTFPAPSSRV